MLSSKLTSKINLMIVVDSSFHSPPLFASIGILNLQGRTVNARHRIGHQYMFFKSLLIFFFMEQEDYQQRKDVRDPEYNICKCFNVTPSFF